MQQCKKIYKSFILIFSEILWIYYTIVMFTSVEWNQPAFFNLIWFVLAAIIGYALNIVLLKIGNHVVLFIGNILVIGFIVIQNWRNVVPEGALGFGLAVSIGLSIIFIRSARLVHRESTRHEVLRRFEGNIIYYIVFAVVFTINDWGNNTFHLFFIIAILSSLIGMILTFENHEDVKDNAKTKVMKVGETGWFTGAIMVLLVCIPLFSLTLLLPSINRGLYALVISVWEGLKWTILQIGIFLSWLFNLFPQQEIGEIDGAPPKQSIITPDVMEETMMSLPYIWFIIGITITLIVIAVWIFAKLLRNRQLPKTTKPKYIIITNESWWEKFQKRLKTYLQYLKLKWCMAFPYFYYHDIYWYYHQVLKWGKKNGINRMKSETSQEYIKKLIIHISAEKSNFTYQGKSYNLAETLKRLNKDYHATYYGDISKINKKSEYEPLIKKLNSINLKKKSLKQRGSINLKNIKKFFLKD